MPDRITGINKSYAKEDKPMPIDYKVFMKHAAKVTTGEHITHRPVLQGVLHKGEGTLYATDSHRLYIARNVAHGEEDGSLLSPKGGKVEGSYPSVERIIPKNPGKIVYRVNIKEFIQAIDLLYAVGEVAEKEKAELMKKEKGLDVKPVVIKFDGDKVYYHSPMARGEVTLSTTFEERISFNGKYFLEALKLFKDNGDQEITLNFYGALSPVTFVNNAEDLLALVLPVRTSA